MPPSLDRSLRDLIDEVATPQHGAVALFQLAERGLDVRTVRRLANREAWFRYRRGVWGLPGSPRTWERDLHATLLMCGERSVVAGRSALILHGLLQRPSAPPVELMVPHDRTLVVEGVRVTRTRTLKTADVMAVEGLRITTVERTLCDVAGRHADRWLRDRVARAVQQDLTTLQRVTERAARLPRAPGRFQLDRVLTQLDGRRTDSGEEREALEWLISLGLEPDETQYPIRCSDGVVIHADFAWIQQRVALEYLGDRWHSLPSAVSTDAVRSNGVVTAGWLQLLLTRDQLRRRDVRFVRQLRGALAERGAS